MKNDYIFSIGIFLNPSTGDFGLAGLEDPLVALDKEVTVLKSDTQPCRHPEKMRVPKVSRSLLELIEAPEIRVIGKQRFKWALVHWGLNAEGEKHFYFESFLFAEEIQFSPENCEGNWRYFHHLWKKDGLFGMERYQKQAKEIERLRTENKRRALAGMIAADKNATVPRWAGKTVSDARAAILKAAGHQASLEALASGDQKKAVKFLSAEMTLPKSPIDKVDYEIIKTYSRDSEIPYDNEIADKICKEHGIPITGNAVKKRRDKFGLFGRSSGPKPKS